MSDQHTSQSQNSIWANEDTGRYLRLRVKTFYNADYFERIVLPLLALPPQGKVLDIGCGYGGLSFSLAGLRPDLQITGVDIEPGSVENAALSAVENGYTNITFEQGDAHQLKYADNHFDAVMCQTVLTHVRDAEAVICEMARVLKPGGVFMAAEYTDSGAWTEYDSLVTSRREEAWHQKYFYLARLYMQGKQALGRGDDRLGNKVPYLAAAAGLDVFDVRLNDRALHVIPPYLHPKQKDYLELLNAQYAPDPNSEWLTQTIEAIRAAGGTEEDARWLYSALEEGAVLQSLEDRDLTMVSGYMLYLTFARKRI